MEEEVAMREKILLVGVGELGGIVLEYVCRIPGIADIVTADTNTDWGFRKTNSAIEGASYMGLYPKIQFHPIDLLNIEKTAEFIKKINPTLIYNATTLQSWWVVNELPPDVNAKLYRDKCALGRWSAMHLALVSKLMKAVKMSGTNPYVLNAAYPDVTHPNGEGRIGADGGHRKHRPHHSLYQKNRIRTAQRADEKHQR